MEFSEVVRRRRMVRGYDPSRPVPRQVLDEVFDLMVRAPSAGFSQGWDFVVLTGPDRELFWSATTPGAAPDRDGRGSGDRWLAGMRTAPVLVLCLSDPQRYLDRYAEPDKGWTDRDPARWPVPYWDTDVSMAAMILLLGAVDAGLGGLFFGVPPERQADVLAAFDIPADRRIVGVVALGYPSPDPAADPRSPSLRRGRRPVAEVVHDGRFTRRWTSDPPAPANP